jgi:sulfite reductase (NADPH) flavoprotein alpha-component
MADFDSILGSSAERIALAGLAVILWLAICLHAWYRQRAETGNPAGLLVAYASQTGTAEALASSAVLQIGQQTGNASGISVLPLNRIRPRHLLQTRRLLLVISTTGQGAAPDNARLFVDRYLTGSRDLGHLEYAMLGLGDRRYQAFCGFALELDGWLFGQGARRTGEVLLADRSNPLVLARWRDLIASMVANADTAEARALAGE